MTVFAFFADSTTRDQPALGEYGWVWVSIVGIGLWVAYIRLQRQREKRESQRHYERIWGQREDETVEEWQARTAQLRKDIEQSRIADEQRRARMAAERNRRRYSDRRRSSSRDFDPPGGWGAMGPDGW